MNTKAIYGPTITALLKHNTDPYELPEDKRPDYIGELGLTVDDIPDLARLAVDNQVSDDESNPEF